MPFCVAWRGMLFCAAGIMPNAQKLNAKKRRRRGGVHPPLYKSCAGAGENLRGCQPRARRGLTPAPPAGGLRLRGGAG